MKKALVLCGGGSKGAYQMGVWQALNELNLKFDIVTGTSIGALNGVMYVQNKYDDCIDLWNNARNDTIMTTPISLEEPSIKASLKKMNDLIPFVRTYIEKKGADITPFKKMMEHYIEPEKVVNSDITFGVMTVSFPQFKPIPKVLNGANVDEVIPYVLASASCFPLFPVCKIGDLSLVDGGYYDNLPINFALELGATEIVAVDLNYAITHKEYLNKPFIKYIYPSWNLGSFFLFEEKAINDNKILGYNDAMKAYGKYDGFRYTFYREELDENLLKSFMIKVANVERIFNQKNLKSLDKTDEGSSIYKILEKYTNSSLNYKEYYLRALEVCAEFFKIDHLKLYTAALLKQLICDKLVSISLEDDELLIDYFKTKTISKKRELLLRANKYDLLCLLSIKEDLFNSENEGLLIDVLLTKPKLIVFLLLIDLWREFNEKTKENEDAIN